MYIIKNALKCICRSKGRNILIGVIVFVIAISSCIGLSIRQASENAKEKTLANMSVTAKISFDRSAAMSKLSGNSEGFDKSSFSNMMGNASSLTLEEYETYAKAESVNDFYYSLTAYVNGNENFEPVSTDTSSDEENDQTDVSESPSDRQSGMSGKANKFMGANSDFTVTGYSAEKAMTAFLEGTAMIEDGEVFGTDSANYECIITRELASFNGLAVGDEIQVSNPNNEEEKYDLKIVGIYSDTSANQSSFSMFGATSSDPANQILINYKTLQEMIELSEETVAGLSEESLISPINGSLSATYVFKGVEEYKNFEEEVRTLGLDETYTVSSSDVTSYENSMMPLNTLSTMAKNFLIVILIIGAIILVVLNIFNIRERKYEIGVLTAMGMKKGKVALQFLTEIFVVTLFAVVLGASAGAISSVPVTNALLENQVKVQEEQSEQVEQNFGRGGKMGGLNMSNTNENISYISEVNSAMNLTVVLQMIVIGILLTLISGMVSMLFVMRYEPLKILSNRD